MLGLIALLLLLFVLYLLIAPASALFSVREAKEYILRLEARISDLENTVVQLKRTIRQWEKDAKPTSEESSAQSSEDVEEPEQEDKTEAASLAEDEVVEKDDADIKDAAFEGVSDEQEPKASEDKAAHVTVSLSQETSDETIREDVASEQPPVLAKSVNLEEVVSTKWSVWVGGIALALGTIFLVKYTIDQGWFVPEARITLAGILSMILLLTGEYLRRNDKEINLYGESSAHIPGILTGVGIIGAFATIFAAHALYNFIGPTGAFVLLAAVSLVALFGAALHGPWLAALGLLGSYATPMLVQTDTRDVWTLFLYLSFIGGVSYVLALFRYSIWIAVAATVGSVFWVLIWMITSSGSLLAGDVLPLSLFILSQIAVVAIYLDRRDGYERVFDLAGIIQNQDRWVLGILIALSALFIPLMDRTGVTEFAILVLGGTLFLLAAVAWRSPQLSSLPLWCAGLFLAIYAAWFSGVEFHTGQEGDPAKVSEFLKISIGFGTAFFVLGFLANRAQSYHASWALAASVTPVLLLIASYYKVTNFVISVPFGAAGLFMSAVYIAVTEWSYRDTNEDNNAEWCSGVYAIAAVSTLSLAAAMLLEKGWLTVAFALMVFGMSWVSLVRPVQNVRYLAALIAGIVLYRIVMEPTIMGGELGSLPILNWLLYGYGIPAAAFAGTAYLFSFYKDDWVVRLFEALSILFVTLLIGQQIHHFLNNGNMYQEVPGIAEVAMHTLSWLGLSLALQSLPALSQRPVLQYGSYLLGAMGLAGVLFGLLINKNPFFTGEDLGSGLIINVLILAYVLPAGLCYVIYLKSRLKLEPIYVNMFGIASGVLIWTYISLFVRRFYQGPILTGATSKEELYTYSAVWLMFGIILLFTGLFRKIAELRYVSFIVIVLTVLKVFFYDLSNLTGILRALSFIGLGVVLVTIGYFYQKFVFPARIEEKPADAASEEGAES